MVITRDNRHGSLAVRGLPHARRRGCLPSGTDLASVLHFGLYPAFWPLSCIEQCRRRHGRVWPVALCPITRLPARRMSMTRHATKHCQLLNRRLLNRRLLNCGRALLRCRVLSIATFAIPNLLQAAPAVDRGTPRIHAWSFLHSNGDVQLLGTTGRHPAESLTPVPWPALARPSTSFVVASNEDVDGRPSPIGANLRPRTAGSPPVSFLAKAAKAGHPRLFNTSCAKDVDGRDMRGHDTERHARLSPLSERLWAFVGHDTTPQPGHGTPPNLAMTQTTAEDIGGRRSPATMQMSQHQRTLA